tara:strand:+ start:304 stop:1023 length:720 start_codon:yes stop_codon:yes gene_type:complete
MDLRATVARLEAALEQDHKGMSADSNAASSSSDMGAMKDMNAGDKKMGMMGSMGDKEMGSMGDKKMGSMGDKEMGSMGDKKMGSMGDKEMGMMGMMGSMKMSPAMATPSALPGFPGASHLYHIGETGFFLNHDEHIELSKEQRTALSQIKEKGLLAKNSADRQIEEAEQGLWELTASEEPEAATIEKQVRLIEKLRGDQRLQFIRAVGEAGQVLTSEQRKALLGQESSQTAPAADQQQH